MINYRYAGAAALVNLHDMNLKAFHQTWVKAAGKNVVLPITEDPDYKSIDSLLLHVLRSAGNYMIWICDKLELPSPEIAPPPHLSKINEEAAGYINHLVERWATPLMDVEEDKFHNKTYLSNWKVPYCIDAMLEHAVMHPIRHEYQLAKLIELQMLKQTGEH